MATLQGAGPCDEDICLSFTSMIRRHVEKSIRGETLSIVVLIKESSAISLMLEWQALGMLKLKVNF